MLDLKKDILFVIDVQEKLAQVMFDRQSLIDNLRKLIKGVSVLNIPIIWMEQNPKGLGPTVPEIAELMSGIEPISKFSFSCCGNDDFMRTFKAMDRDHILLSGIEAHICVYQTALDLIGLGYDVAVVSDCISSRTLENKNVALARMRDEGVKLTSTEMALFELLKVAEGELFQEISRIVK